MPQATIEKDKPVTKGRPKSAEKREQIFIAATELFPQYGFDNVSMDMVAEHAGVSKQTVYSHFRSKDELYSACISRKCKSYQLAAEFLDSDQPIEVTLLEIARRFVSLLLSREAIQIYRISVGHAEQRPDIARLFYQAGPEPTKHAIAEYLQSQHDKGILQLDDAYTATCQFLFMLKGDAVMRASLNIEPQYSAKEIEAYMKSCVKVFLRAYAVPTK